MAKFIKSYNEYLDTLITMIRDFSDAYINRIRLALTVCDSLYDDSEKIYRLNKTVMECLWDNPQAVRMGFPQFIKAEYIKTRHILEYHQINCEGLDCYICNDRQVIKIKLRNNNERKEPRIHN
jgi:hypothetical protein